MAAFLRKYDAELGYTTDDDGIHLKLKGVSGEIVFWDAEEIDTAVTPPFDHESGFSQMIEGIKAIAGSIRPATDEEAQVAKKFGLPADSVRLGSYL